MAQRRKTDKKTTKGNGTGCLLTTYLFFLVMDRLRAKSYLSYNHEGSKSGTTRGKYNGL